MIFANTPNSCLACSSGKIHHMLINQTTQHIIHNPAHTHYHQRIRILHYFFPDSSIEIETYLAEFFSQNNKCKHTAEEVANEVIDNA